MSPTPNYYPKGTTLKLKEKTFCDCQFISVFCMDLADSYLNIRYNIGLQFSLNYWKHVKSSSVRQLTWNRRL